MENATEVADVLDKAADEVLLRGWASGNIVNSRGEVCTVGAVAYARGMDVDLTDEDFTAVYEAMEDDPAMDALDAQIRMSSPPDSWWLNKSDSVDCVWSWNDWPERTEDDVHDLLRATAKGLRG